MLAVVCTAVSTATALGADAPEQKHVLIMHSFARDAAPFGSVAATFRSELTKRFAAPVIFDEINLESGRLGAKGSDAVIAFLNARSPSRPPDVIVALGPPAAKFCSVHRAELFPAVPRVMVGEERLVRTISTAQNDALVMLRLSLRDTIDGILRALPDTERVAVVLGAAEPDRFWATQIERELANYADRLEVVPLSGKPFDEIEQAVATLPPHSVVLYDSLSLDGRGFVFEREDALARLHRVTTAPIFGVLEDEMGQGIVGGTLLSETFTASAIADTVLRILAGDNAYERTVVLPTTPPTYDWRELQRWHIADSVLPPDSVVRFRPPSVWEAYRTTIVVIAAVIALQTVLIALLLIQRLRRRRAEAEVLTMSARLISAHEDERRRLAGELHDDFSQRLARLAIDASQLEPHADPNGAKTARTMRDELIRISEDVHDLSYRLHPSIVDDLGLTAALRAECSRTARGSNLQVDVRVGDVPERIAPDIALCLFRVAQEALHNVVRHARATTVDVSLDCVDDALHFVARDDGQGFVHVKRGSLGIASMRERVRLFGGRLSVDSVPGRGTSVSAWVPLAAVAQ